MNKRDNLLSILDEKNKPSIIPAAFFLHFDPSEHQGQAAIDKHLEFFHYTGMDFVKIQYERTFPYLPDILQPDDWRNMPVYGLDFYEPQLQVVDGLVKAAKNEALILLTLYSPYMCACHTAGIDVVTRHILENPQAVQQGMQHITDSLMGFVDRCIELGVDGFYTSTQGGEAGHFPDQKYFDECIKPYDLALMNEINQRCEFNILHVCDYVGTYADLSPFLNYPGQVVSCPLTVGGEKLELSAASQLFNRPVMGGLDRHGVLVSGDAPAIEAAVVDVLRSAPERFILGADCTVPSDIDWDHLRLAIDMSHNFL